MMYFLRRWGLQSRVKLSNLDDQREDGLVRPAMTCVEIGEEIG